MRRLLAGALALSFVLPVQPVSSEPEVVMARHGRLQLDTMPLGQLVVILMRDVMRVPYVIQPDVIADRRPMSIDIRFDRAEMPVPIVRFLRAIGLEVKIEGGTVYVAHRDPAGQNVAGISQQSESGGSSLVTVSPYQGTPAIPSGSPLQPYSPGPTSTAYPSAAASVEDDRTIAVVALAYRSTAEVAETLRVIFPDMLISARGENRAQNGQIVGFAEPERMILADTQRNIEMAKAVVLGLDKPRPQVKLSAVIFEVRRSESKASALQLLADLLGGRVSVSAGATPAVGGDFLRIATGGLSAVLSVTRGDGRFQVVAEPSLLALSGSRAVLKSGNQVPTVGSVTFTDDGRPIRSIEYRDSGISLIVLPRVRDGEIEIDLEQERSSFSRTNTGVDETPTLSRSTSSNRFALAPGETVAVVGLDERSEEASRSGFLGGLLGSRSRLQGSGQLLVVVQADLAPDARKGATFFEILGSAVDGEDGEGQGNG